MQKNGSPKVPRKQVRIPIGIIDLFAYSILKNLEILSNQGLFKGNQQPNWYLRLPVMFGLQCKKNGPPNVPGKKFVFQSELSTYSLILF